MHETPKLMRSSRLILALAATMSFSVADAVSPAPCNGSSVFPPCYNATSSDVNENTAGGSGALITLTSSGSTAFGFNALSASTTSAAFNTAVGARALLATTGGSYNTGVGYNALTANTIGSYNTAAGFNSLLNNTEGDRNTAIGIFSLRDNTDGSHNTAVGVQALMYNVGGDDNTATGYNAMASNISGNLNTALGASALQTNSSGSSNAAFGRAALFKNTTGNSNMGMGNAALSNNKTGSNNIAIGASAGTNLTGGNSNIYIGSPGGTATESRVMRLGDAQTSAYIAGVSTAAITDGVSVMIDPATGQLGTNALSSARYKQDVQPMSDQGAQLQKLRPVTFRYKTNPQAEQFGLIAEEVADVYPQLVTHNAKGEVEAVQYNELIPLLLKQIQQLQAQNQAMSERLTRLEADHSVASR